MKNDLQRVLFFLFLLNVHSAQASSFADIIDEYLQRMSEFGFSGAALIAQDETRFLEKGYGYADRSTGEKVDINTPFFVASITKPFTAIAILHLQTRGRLDISKSISTYIDHVPIDKKSITVESLLTHTSGLPEECFLNYEEISTNTAITNILGLPLVSKPGEKFLYSNAGYNLLAALVEIISGTTYEDYVTTYVLKPSQMEHTAFLGQWNKNWDEHSPAHTYNMDDDSGSSAKWTMSWGFRGAGGLMTTVGDLFLWNQSLMKGKLLPPEVVAQSFLPRVDAHKNMKYGYGWWTIFTDQGSQIRYHGGSHVPQGATAEFRYYPESKITTIVLVNSMIDDSGGSRWVRDCLAAAIFGGSCHLPPKALETISERNDQGIYRLATGGTLRIENRNGKLRIVPSGQDAVDALLSYPKESRKSYDAIQEKIRNLIHALSNNDDGTVLKLTDQERATTFQEDWKKLIDSNGEFQDFALLGTIPENDEGATVTFYTLNFSKGKVIQRMISDQNDLSYSLNGSSPGRWWLVPQSKNVFLSFDPLLSQTIRVSVEGLNLHVWNSEGKETVAARDR